MIAILTGMLYLRTVASSCEDIWNPPSPVIAQTGKSGRPRAAPIAAGKP